jgi:hypothetical protein
MGSAVQVAGCGPVDLAMGEHFRISAMTAQHVRSAIAPFQGVDGPYG